MPIATRHALLAAVAVLLAGALVGAIPIGPPAGGSTQGATVIVQGPSGDHQGTVQVRVADTPTERYRGLSDTARLGEDEGMLFVFPREGERAFVMRDMNYPLDIVFVNADREIVAIHHAPVENDGDLRRYTGRAKWVLEVNRGWTTRHDVEVGDRIRILGRNQTSVQAK